MTEQGEKVVCRFTDGHTLKGYLAGFTTALPEFSIRPESGGESLVVRLDDLKAVFFVRTFEGDNSYREKKSYGTTCVKGNRAFVKFRDGESLIGFLEGEIPWKRGFFLSGSGVAQQGFFLLPCDEGSNNIKVFVVAAAVNDVTVVP